LKPCWRRLLKLVMARAAATAASGLGLFVASFTPSTMTQLEKM
jgi:hypothetical protein